MIAHCRAEFNTGYRVFTSPTHPDAPKGTYVDPFFSMVPIGSILLLISPNNKSCYSLLLGLFRRRIGLTVTEKKGWKYVRPGCIGMWTPDGMWKLVRKKTARVIWRVLFLTRNFTSNILYGTKYEYIHQIYDTYILYVYFQTLKKTSGNGQASAT